MTKKKFLGELLLRLDGIVDLGQECPIAALGETRYYENGFTSDDENELSFIRETNIRYHRKESDVLIGDFIVIRSGKDLSEVYRFECDYLYQTYEKEGWKGVWDIIRENQKLMEHMHGTGVMDLMAENNYEVLKDKLIIRPLNYQDHRYELKDKIYKRAGDIVLVLYILASDERNGEQHDVYSIKVPNSMVTNWEISDDEVWENALMNTYLLAPPRMYLNPMDTYKPPYQKGAFMAVGSKMNSLSANAVPTLTTTSQMNGAIAFFYPGVMQRIAEMFGGDYYVSFTSIHDVRLHKKGVVPPRTILSALKDTNRTFDPTEILSRKIYLYEQGKGELKQLDL